MPSGFSLNTGLPASRQRRLTLRVHVRGREVDDRVDGVVAEHVGEFESDTAMSLGELLGAFWDSVGEGGDLDPRELAEGAARRPARCCRSR